jgi:hypothetical protein
MQTFETTLESQPSKDYSVAWSAVSELISYCVPISTLIHFDSFTKYIRNDVKTASMSDQKDKMRKFLSMFFDIADVCNNPHVALRCISIIFREVY